MNPISLSFSSTLVPQIHYEDIITSRCGSVVSRRVPVMKNQFSHTRRLSFTRYTRIPSLSGVATESRNVNVRESPTSVPVRVANELLQAGHRYLDVRTSEEFSSGHVVGAVNVPFMLRVGPEGMTRNPKFVEQVLTRFTKDDEIIVGCQLGKRSLMAASELVSVGFTGITDMAGGYAAWVQNRLPSTDAKNT